jgi:hypothetical protein
MGSVFDLTHKNLPQTTRFGMRPGGNGVSPHRDDSGDSPCHRDFLCFPVSVVRRTDVPLRFFPIPPHATFKVLE